MKPKLPREGEPVLVTFRMPGVSTDPFLIQTDAWLAEVRADFRKQMGAELSGCGVLFAYDVLSEIHGADASWDHFDVGAFERWVHENQPEFVCMIPTMLAELACFANFLARTRRFSIEQAIAIQARTIELCTEQLFGRRGPAN